MSTQKLSFSAKSESNAWKGSRRLSPMHRREQLKNLDWIANVFSNLLIQALESKGEVRAMAGITGSAGDF